VRRRPIEDRGQALKRTRDQTGTDRLTVERERERELRTRQQTQRDADDRQKPVRLTQAVLTEGDFFVTVGRRVNPDDKVLGMRVHVDVAFLHAGAQRFDQVALAGYDQGGMAPVRVAAVVTAEPDPAPKTDEPARPRRAMREDENRPGRTRSTPRARRARNARQPPPRPARKPAWPRVALGTIRFLLSTFRCELDDIRTISAKDFFAAGHS
jgi:hypothetical protein